MQSPIGMLSTASYVQSDLEVNEIATCSIACICGKLFWGIKSVGGGHLLETEDLPPPLPNPK
eukprot:6281064-Amphidinium_carterae.1